jgi:hypothetical protein
LKIDDTIDHMTMSKSKAEKAPHIPPPEFVRPNFERMPAELKERPNWVLWVPIWTGSKWTKRPIQVCGFGASTTKSKHWSSFDEVRQAYERAVERGYRTLDRWRRLDEGPPITKLGRRPLYRRSSLQAWLRAQEHRAHSGNGASESRGGAK